VLYHENRTFTTIALALLQIYATVRGFVIQMTRWLLVAYMLMAISPRSASAQNVWEICNDGTVRARIATVFSLSLGWLFNGKDHRLVAWLPVGPGECVDATETIPMGLGSGQTLYIGIWITNHRGEDGMLLGKPNRRRGGIMHPTNRRFCVKPNRVNDRVGSLTDLIQCNNGYVLGEFMAYVKPEKNTRISATLTIAPTPYSRIQVFESPEAVAARTQARSQAHQQRAAANKRFRTDVQRVVAQLIRETPSGFETLKVPGSQTNKDSNIAWRSTIVLPEVTGYSRQALVSTDASGRTLHFIRYTSDKPIPSYLGLLYLSSVRSTISRAIPDNWTQADISDRNDEMSTRWVECSDGTGTKAVLSFDKDRVFDFVIVRSASSTCR